MEELANYVRRIGIREVKFEQSITYDRSCRRICKTTITVQSVSITRISYMCCSIALNQVAREMLALINNPRVRFQMLVAQNRGLIV